MENTNNQNNINLNEQIDFPVLKMIVIVDLKVYKVDNNGRIKVYVIEN